MSGGSTLYLVCHQIGFGGNWVRFDRILILRKVYTNPINVIGFAPT